MESNVKPKLIDTFDPKKYRSDNRTELKKVYNRDGKVSPYIHKEVISVAVKYLEPAEFQREINWDRVKVIADEFDIHKWRIPVAGIDKTDGRLKVFDGQHRVEAVRMKFGDEAIIDIELDSVGLSCEMARLYAHQDDNRVNLNSVDKFKAMVVGKEEVPTAVNKILSELGLEVSGHKNGKTIQAANVMIQAYNKLGPIMFKRMVKVMKEGFGENPSTWGGLVIKGMAQFFSYFSAEGINDADLIKRMQRLDPRELCDKSRVISPKKPTNAFAYLVADAYNYKRHGVNKLNNAGLLA